uniref:AgfB protein n=1 Tax=Salmonella typhimurium TaxID=90371 RepID=O33801_SALTM|nr:AgfB protein [Salmonella enterica subsp. enterica serovar Typhimurium]
MKNKLLFMMLTILGEPIATATNYDLARSEYNFAVNELSKSSFNQAAIIGQVGTDNSARVRHEGSKLLSVISQERGGNNRAKVDQAGNYNFAYIEQTGNANDASISQSAYGNSAAISAAIIQKGSGNKANITQYGTQKTAVVVQKQSHMAIQANITQYGTQKTAVVVQKQSHMAIRVTQR